MAGEFRHQNISDIKADLQELKGIIFLHGQLIAVKAYEAPGGFGVESQRSLSGFLSLIKSFDASVSMLGINDPAYMTWKRDNMKYLSFKRLKTKDFREEFLDKLYEWVAQIYQLVDRNMHLVPAKDITIRMGAVEQNADNSNESDKE